MKKFKKTYIFLTLLSFILVACTQPTENPKTVADKYWQYIQAGNIKEAKKLTTENNRNIVQKHINRINKNTKINTDAATAIVNTNITTTESIKTNSAATNSSSHYSHTKTFNTVLVLQQGKWKVDLNNSPIPPASSVKEKDIKQLSQALSESMQKNVESIDQAVTQGMQMLNEALRDSSKEMGDSLLNLMNELNGSMQKSIDQMQKRREQKEQKPDETNKQPSQKTQPDPRKGEGII